jgi:hypothetical protein
MKPDSVTAGGPRFRHRLVGLWEIMKPINLARLVMHAEYLAVVRTDKNSALEAEVEKKALEYPLSVIAEDCEALRLPVTLAAIRDMQRECGQLSPDPVELRTLAREFNNRLRAELEGRSVFELTSQEAALYEQPVRGWETVIAAFPSATGEIEEASKCFALARYTACAFHMMRAFTPVLGSIAKELAFTPGSPTWNAYISPIKDSAKKKYPDDKNPTHREKHRYFGEIEGHLRSIALAWRNPTMHDVEKTYTEEMATALMASMKGCMLHAAKELKE